MKKAKAFNDYKLNEARATTVWVKGDDKYVDSDFVNFSKGVLPNSELKHYGGGDFFLDTPDGFINFIRSGDKLDGMVGRSHKMDDDKGGKLRDKLIKKMKSKIINEEVVNEDKKEKDGWDYRSSKVPSAVETAKRKSVEDGKTYYVNENPSSSKKGDVWSTQEDIDYMKKNGTKIKNLRTFKGGKEVKK